MINAINIQNLSDINKPNEPFNVIGKIIPVFQDGKWSFTECLFEKQYEKHYPVEDLKCESYIDNPNQIIYFYYDGNECVGQIEIKKNWNKYALIRDIAVSKNSRRKGIGSKLIKKRLNGQNKIIFKDWYQKRRT